jgi:hypothetical protein
MTKQMVWSMYKDTEGEYDTWQENPVAYYTNYDIDASPLNRVKFFRDGVYTVYFDGQSTEVTVVGGQFDIEKTKVAIGEIVERAGYHGAYIEGFDKRKGKIEVCIGS